jgi:2-iminobutanoate/2-iminopropanoate deaminase
MAAGKKMINVSGSLNLPYTPAVRAGDYIFVSGQTGHIDSAGNKVEGLENQTRQCLEKMKSVLVQSGASLGDIVKTGVFLKNPQDFPGFNEIYKTYFPSDPPARTTIFCGLPFTEMLVEIDCIAYCGD